MLNVAKLTLHQYALTIRTKRKFDFMTVARETNVSITVIEDITVKTDINLHSSL